jgi:hypothetical protein
MFGLFPRVMIKCFMLAHQMLHDPAIDAFFSLSDLMHGHT